MIDFLNANEVFEVHGVYPHEAGHHEQMLLGRFLIENGKLRILEDHQGLLGSMLHQGLVGPNVRALNSLAQSGYTKVVPESELVQGHHIDRIPQGNPSAEGEIHPQSPPTYTAPEAHELIEEAPKEFGMSTPPAIFDYQDGTMKQPQILELNGDKVLMNGRELGKDVVDRILYKVKSGLATLRYRRGV